MEIEKRVIRVFNDVFNSATITIDAVKNDIEPWDSVGHLQLIMNLEAEFNIKFKTEEMNKIVSVKKCIEYVNKLLSEK